MHLLTFVLTIASTHLGGVGLAALLATCGLALGACMTAPGNCGAPELGTALGQSSSCGNAPVPRDWHLIDQMTKARGVSPGGTPYVNFNGWPAQDSLFRYCHVKSIKISGSVNLTTDGANAAVTAYQMRSLLQQFFLSDAGGHFYLAAIDGRTIVDDFWLRGAYRLPQPLDGAVPAALPAGVHRFRIDIELALVARFPGASPTEGIISLAALQQTNGSQGMRFTCAQGIAGNPAGIQLGDNPGNPANVVFVRDDGQEGLDVWIEYVYTDQPIIDAPWSLREYQIAEQSSTLKSPNSKTEYAAVRYFPEDAALFAGQQLAAGIDNVTLQVGGMMFGQQRAIDMVRRQAFLEISAPESAAALGLANLALPAEPGVTEPYLMICPARPRETAPAGAIVYNFSTQPATFTRFIHRTCDCDTGERAGRILDAIKCGASTCLQPSNPLTAGGTPSFGVSDPTAPKIVVPLSQSKVG